MIKSVSSNILCNSGSYNIVGQAVWAICFILTIANELGILASPIYETNRGLFWATGLVAYIIGFLNPCEKIIDKNNSISVALFLSVFWVLQFCIALTVYIFLKNNSNETHFPFTSSHLIQIVTSFFAASAVAIGWFVHAHTQKNTQRRQHTVNVLNSSRMSEVYQENLEKYSMRYSRNKPISKKNVDIYVKWNKKGGKLSDEKLEIVESIRNAIYLLNFYEFVAVGINKGDMDDEYLYETVSFIVSGLLVASRELILEVRKDDPAIYEHIDNMNSRWENITRDRKEG